MDVLDPEAGIAHPNLGREPEETLVLRADVQRGAVVVDNGSADGTREWLAREEKRLAPRLRVIAHAENRGFAAACNAVPFCAFCPF